MFEGPVQRLFDELSALPGIGAKSARRLTFYMLGEPKENMERLANAILTAVQTMQVCTRCFNVSEAALCRICQDPRRDAHHICVVADAKDIQAIEQTGEFRGTYHVLGGLLMPINGITGDMLNIAPLLTRTTTEQVTDILLAFNPTVDGETTGNFVHSQLIQHQPSLRITKIASGMPAGGDLEYTDQVTLGRAIAGRTTL